MKVCSCCNTSKAEADFSRDKSTKDGLRNRCRLCMSEIFKAHYKSNPEYNKARTVKWNLANPEKRKRAVKRAGLRANYGLSLEDYDRMLLEQRGCCAICDQVMSLPYVDHCHKTGRVRALLCPSCNTGIGGLKDSPRLCIRASEYLQKFLG